MMGRFQMNFIAVISAFRVGRFCVFLGDRVLLYATEASISGRIDPSWLRISAGMVLYWFFVDVINLLLLSGLHFLLVRGKYDCKLISTLKRKEK